MDRLTSFLFSDGGYSPHGFCIAWDWRVLYTHIGADLLIALSYFAIPLLILVFLKRRADSRLRRPAVLFVGFITLCGISHLMSIVTMYLPWYGLQGAVKLVTGVVSVLTAVALFRLLPDALRIPSIDSLEKVIAQRDTELARRKETQQDLDCKNRMLDEKNLALAVANDELGRFTYAASHELKSPANTLSLWMESFKEEAGSSLSKSQRESLNDADILIERMRGLVEDVLVYSRVAGSAQTDFGPVDIHALFRAALDAVGDEINAYDIAIHFSSLPKVWGNADQLKLLADNLVSNAVKFHDPARDNEIRIKGRPTELNGGPGVCIVVADKGIGIDAKHNDRIMDLFGRLHRPEDYEGSGLGLALCRRIVANHGGHIQIVSQPDQGAEFRVTLKAEESHVTKAA